MNREQKILSLLAQLKELSIDQQIDYDKFCLYSIITNSTAIEGSTITEIENQLLFDEGISAKGHLMTEQLMNLDLKAAYEQSIAFAKSHSDITIEMLKKLSSTVLKNTGTTYQTALGEFSSTNGDLRLLNVTAGTGGCSYINYSKVPTKLAELCENINQRRKSLSKTDIIECYKLSFDTHFHLATIHPWADGNGRMSRLLMNQLQLEFDITLTNINKDRKAEYLEALITTRETDDIELFHNFMFDEHIRNLEQTIHNYQISIKDEGLQPHVDISINNANSLTTKVTDRIMTNNILIYTTPDGKKKLEVNLKDETLWLSLDQIAELFQRNKSTISRHIKNIFEEGELDAKSVVAKFATTASDGKTYQVDYYNLDMIISVGYRVNSLQGTHFRIWATQVLKEYMIKGFAMDDERLKRGGGGNYFDELLSRIRDIRSSEKLFYRKVLEIYALSIDYDPRNEVTKEFFASVQNKMHYAVHGKTAAELIYSRADAQKDFMGLTSWTGCLPHKSDTDIAKNYLSKEEIDTLNRIVSLYLDFAELQALDKHPMYMKDWLSKLDDFLKLSGKELLHHVGVVSAEMAKLKAYNEYDQFKERIQYELSPVEIHFLESFEETQKKLKK